MELMHVICICYCMYMFSNESQRKHGRIIDKEEDDGKQCFSECFYMPGIVVNTLSQTRQVSVLLLGAVNGLPRWC